MSLSYKLIIVNELKFSISRIWLYSIIWLIIFFFMTNGPTVFDSMKASVLQDILSQKPSSEILRIPVHGFIEIYLLKQMGLLFFMQFILISFIFSMTLPLDAEKGFLTLINTTGINMPLLIIFKAIIVSILLIFIEFFGWIILLVIGGLTLFQAYPSLLIEFITTSFNNLLILFFYNGILIFIFVSLVYYSSFFLDNFKISALIMPSIVAVQEILLSEFFKLFPLQEAPDRAISLWGVHFIIFDLHTWNVNNIISFDGSVSFCLGIFLAVFYLLITLIFYNLSFKRQYN